MSTEARGGRVGSAAFWLGLLLVLVVLAVLVAGGTNREPLDPRSTADDGAKALVELIASFGAEVDLGVSLPGVDHDVAVLLRDSYGVADREVVEDWVSDGGRLLVADGESPLSPIIAREAGDTAEGPCEVAALAAVRRLEVVPQRFRAPADGALCIDGAVAVDPLGSGVIVSVGGPEPLLNAHLDRADNAVLATATLAPAAGTVVAVLEPRLVAGAGGERLRDLVPDGLWVLLIQLGVAFLLLAWWQARRLGAPVDEAPLVTIDGSELAAARGRLLAGIRRPDAAATELRAETRRTIAGRLGLPADAPSDVIATHVALLAGTAPGEVVALLENRPITGDDDLLALGAGLAGLRRAVASADFRPLAGPDRSPGEPE